MKIRSVRHNNRKKVFEVGTSTKKLVFPFSKAVPTPTTEDPVTELSVAWPRVVPPDTHAPAEIDPVALRRHDERPVGHDRRYGEEDHAEHQIEPQRADVAGAAAGEERVGQKTRTCKQDPD